MLLGVEWARNAEVISREFKLEAVSLIFEGGLSISQAARDLGIDKTVLGRWKKQFEDNSEHAFPGKGKLKPENEELARLRRELAIGIFPRAPK